MANAIEAQSKLVLSTAEIGSAWGALGDSIHRVSQLGMIAHPSAENMGDFLTLHHYLTDDLEARYEALSEVLRRQVFPFVRDMTATNLGGS